MHDLVGGFHGFFGVWICSYLCPCVELSCVGDFRIRWGVDLLFGVEGCCAFGVCDAMG